MVELQSDSNEKIRERVIAHALYSLPGLGSANLMKLLEECGSTEGILNCSADEIKSVIGVSVWNKNLYRMLEDYKMNPDLVYAEMERDYRKLIRQDIHFSFIGDSEYPNRLRFIADAPFGIFYKGRLPDDSKPVVSVIGARECSEYGRRCAEIYGKTLAEYGVQIISGMARGIDGISQQAALDGGGASFGILGCGVDVCYPKENRLLYDQLIKNGGVISEFSPGTEAKSNFFPMRNRIISGLADILLVVEARKKSGTYITVCQALEQGREIYAVPGRITDGLSDGCNRLIAEGAGIAADPQVLLDALCGVDGVRFVNNVNNTSILKNACEEYYVNKSGDKVDKTRNNDLNYVNHKESYVNRDEDYVNQNEGCFTKGINYVNQRKRCGTKEMNYVNHDICIGNRSAENKLTLRSAILRSLEETPVSMELIMERLSGFGVDVSYSEILCELTNLCIDGRVEGIGNYYKKC